METSTLSEPSNTCSIAKLASLLSSDAKEEVRCLHYSPFRLLKKDRFGCFWPSAGGDSGSVHLIIRSGLDERRALRIDGNTALPQ